MAYLGIDVGSKICGLALSVGGDLATPLTTVPFGQLIQEIQKLQKKYNDLEIVLGNPRSNTIQEDPNQVRVRDLAIMLKGQGFLVHLCDETNSTGYSLSLAEHVRGSGRGVSIVPRSERMDATAAALILQGYLDTRKGPRSVLD